MRRREVRIMTGIEMMKIDDLIHEREPDEWVVEWDDEVGFEIIREDEYGQRI
jgi:hypothetical protein